MPYQILSLVGRICPGYVIQPKDIEKSPYDALNAWQKVSEDYSFKPLTIVDAQIKEVQAYEILEKAKTQLIPALYERLERNLPTHSDGIIQKCQEALLSHVERQRDLAVHRFKGLCERYNEAETKESSTSPRMLNIEKGLREILTLYENDEKFMKTIERSHDKNIQKIAEIFKSQDLTIEQPEASRGFER